MKSVLGEIKKIRKEKPFVIDTHNHNRYRVVGFDDSGIRTAYYFTTPIYNEKTRKILNLKFNTDNGIAYYTGSNADVRISQNIKLENTDGYCCIDISDRPMMITESEVICGENIIVPTTNGVAIKCNAKIKKTFAFEVEINNSLSGIRRNSKYLAFMKERFKPFIVFSCIGCMDAYNNVIAPAKIEYEKISEKKYRIVISATDLSAQYIMFECNLYENKLLQDTTVESVNPLSNNAFGGVGFVGDTSLYGQQWLYSKLDYLKIADLMDKRIKKFVLHIPKLNDKGVDLSAFKVSSRFCSFGSNWNNKISGSVLISNSISSKAYHSFDLTSLFVEPRTRTMMRSNGLILKTKIKDSGFSAISTGDSSYAPQIIEVAY